MNIELINFLTRNTDNKGLIAEFMDVGSDRAKPGHKGEVENSGHGDGIGLGTVDCNLKSVSVRRANHRSRVRFKCRGVEKSLFQGDVAGCASLIPCHRTICTLG